MKQPVISFDTLNKIVQGDQDSFRILFDTYQDNIYTTALFLTGDEWLAQEIVQETFIKIWLQRSQILKIENLETWIYVIAKNCALNLIKSNRNKELLLTKFQQEIRISYPHIETEILVKELQNILTKAIDRLPPKQRQTYQLIKEEDLKRDEVAKIMNISPETVKSNLKKATESIRIYCEKELKDLPFVIALFIFTKYL